MLCGYCRLVTGFMVTSPPTLFPFCSLSPGMQPVLYSTRQQCWMRVGSDVTYYKNNFIFKRKRRRRDHHTISTNTSGTRVTSSHPGDAIKTFYTLTFTVEFPLASAGDVCYLAYHYPFTYSMLQVHSGVARLK